jgi:cell fate regulator YaaT (PSP1 superfamily)
MEQESSEKQKFVVGIQYRKAGKIYTFLTDDQTLLRGDFVVVESEQGASVGTVALPPQPVSEADLPKDIKKVLHRASQEELTALATQNEREMEIFELFASRVKEQNLPMKPLAAELRDGEKKVILTFFAEERVDFRTLVKDLATALHMRIEMHQVGARDEVKLRGGIGSCGLYTCCSKYLRQFQSISIQMAKNQGLTPNPAKLTGLCNKLKCCLSYENALYAEIRQRLPRVGMLVKTPQGNGKVASLDILNEQCVVRLDEGGETKVHLRDITPQSAKVEVKEGASEKGLVNFEDKPKPQAEKPTHRRSDRKEKRHRK